MYQIWNDLHGNRLDVHPDRDGLEIREYTADDVVLSSITLDKEQARLLAEVLLDLI